MEILRLLTIVQCCSLFHLFCFHCSVIVIMFIFDDLLADTEMSTSESVVQGAPIKNKLLEKFYISTIVPFFY